MFPTISRLWLKLFSLTTPDRGKGGKFSPHALLNAPAIAGEPSQQNQATLDHHHHFISLFSPSHHRHTLANVRGVLNSIRSTTTACHHHLRKRKGNCSTTAVFAPSVYRTVARSRP
ncbi:hypothetical protein BJ508DRAFT_412978 [Ascobolus immersus RN42]|uniref:Uncharacterized protein n=1 Tax=Ascobolus immersus RN42 TaxID=1160509 RepID=A0A3N4IEC3_ASCIM|nr:hypothetical protein BJ508DRAFT_412978 [Ascobolus immersus RN42]